MDDYTVQFESESAHGAFFNGLSAEAGSVIPDFARRAPAPIQLALMAAGLAIVVGIPIGILAGLRAGSRFVGALSRAIGAIGMGVPDFVLGTLFVYVTCRRPGCYWCRAPTFTTWTQLVDGN